jgi:hypothetical protein
MLRTINTATGSTSKQILHVKSVTEIHTHLQGVQGRKLFAIDKDETLTICRQHFGTSRWSYAHMDHLTASLNDYPAAFAATIQKYIYAQNHTEVDPVEGTHTIDFMRNVHTEDHKVLIVTARGPEIASATEKQLKANNIMFNITPEFKDRHVDLHQHVPYSRALNGVIYTHGGNKGICLEQYLQVVECQLDHIDHIIAVDDKEYNLEHLAEAAARLNKPFIGFRYGALDHLLEDIRLHVADLQYSLHQQGKSQGFISDEEAHAMLDAAQNQIPNADQA